MFTVSSTLTNLAIKIDRVVPCKRYKTKKLSAVDESMRQHRAKSTLRSGHDALKGMDDSRLGGSLCRGSACIMRPSKPHHPSLKGHSLHQDQSHLPFLLCSGASPAHLLLTFLQEPLAY